LTGTHVAAVIDDEEDLNRLPARDLELIFSTSRSSL
jgi:hypothetical protein